jgi:NTE family protein
MTEPTPAPDPRARSIHGRDCAFDLSPYQRIALVLQGGGALGAYQAGAYQALAEAAIPIDWVAGISIGAINAAIIAGNAPEHRVEKLESFWNGVTTPIAPLPFMTGDFARTWFNAISATTTVMMGQSGFFKPRPINPWFAPQGSAEALSYYDTGPLRATLEKLVDFDRINARITRFSVGSVNVRTGNFVYFDNAERKIGPEHVMASGSLPPGFPPVEIDGQFYWDGGVVSNTPLSYVLNDIPRSSTLAFQVDLFSANGVMPADMGAVAERQKDIMYSSRTRANTDAFKREQQMRAAVRYLLNKLPPKERGQDHICKLIEQAAQLGDSDPVYNIIHLIYREKSYETDQKDYEFSRATKDDHWESGLNDAKRTLRHPEWFKPPSVIHSVAIHDVHREAKD